jgi:tetratricopeptide (TPR) repeat protein
MLKKIILLIFIILLTANAQSNLKVVRLDACSEAWLAADRQKALDILSTREAEGDHEIITRYNIGYLYFLQGNYDKAIMYFQTIVKKDPSFPYSHLQIARIHMKMGNYLAARNHLQNGLDEDSDNIEILNELAVVNLKLNETDEVIELFEEILDEDENNIQATAGLAAIYRKEGKLEQARALLEDNTSIFPEGSILLEKSKVYSELGSMQKSKKFLIQILNDYPYSAKWSRIQDTLRLKYNLQQIPDPPPLPSYKYEIDPKETLDYKVTYGPMTLGWLKVRIKQPEIIAGRRVYPIIFHVDTNPSYGFILSLHHIYESYIEPETMNAIKSRLYTPGSDNYLVRAYYYNYDENIFDAYIIDAEGRFVFMEKDLPRKVQDSTSMLFFARGLVSEKLSGVTTVVIDEEYKYGHIKFLNETEALESEGKDVDAIKIFARAEFKGVAGMNGDAWGWFSPNEEAMPLKGAIEIIIGSITVEIDEEKTAIPNFHE